jgi:ribosome-associated protein
MRDDAENRDDAVPEVDDGRPSKSARKREMTARQALGERLCALSPRELEQIPLPNDELLAAIEQSRQITANSARRRHMQFIGKLMRDIDPEPLREALESLHAGHAGETSRLHALEALRDDLLARGNAGIEQVLARWPQADRQHLRQLLRQAQRERETDRPPAAYRKLFRYLRELDTSS